MLFTPLEQFEVYIIEPLSVNTFGILMPNYFLYTLLIIIISLIVGICYCYRTGFYLTFSALIIELIYKFIASITSRHCGLDGLIFFPLFILTFILVLFMNLFGLLPLGFTLTGQLIIPVVLAVSFNLFFFLNGFERHGIKFLSVFVPSGVPAFLLPLVVLIEIISYLLRSFSLSVRLFANMMAGHTLLYILSSFVVALSDISLILALVPTLLVFAVSFFRNRYCFFTSLCVCCLIIYLCY